MVFNKICDASKNFIMSLARKFPSNKKGKAEIEYYRTLTKVYFQGIDLQQITRL